MLHIFKFPDIGEGITEGKVLEIYVKKGQKVKEGDSLVKVETDKVVTDIPCPKTGVIKNIFAKVGEIINVDEALAEIEIEGTTEEAEPKKEKAEEKGFGVVGVIDDAESDAFLPSTGEGIEEDEEKKSPSRKKTLATPVARKMAKDYGLDINEIKGSGPAGRVMKVDIKRAFDNKQKGDDKSGSKESISEKEKEELYEIEELSQVRKTIITKMVESKFTAPHATAFEEVEVSKLIELRNEKKEILKEKGVKLSYMAFIIKAVTNALKEHKTLNCRLDTEKNRVIYNKFYNIGIAVDSPTGLIVPVIRSADKKSIIEIAKEVSELAEKARNRELPLTALKDGTFSITNYGSIAGIWGVPIINYPEVAILGTGRIIEKPVVKDGNVDTGHFLPLSLSFDHRIIDGGDAARFIKDLMLMLNDPITMLMM